MSTGQHALQHPGGRTTSPRKHAPRSSLSCWKRRAARGFACALTSIRNSASTSARWNTRLFNLRRGEPANMCLFEALTFLLAARLWLPVAATKGCRVKSDNIAALRLAISLSSRSPNLTAWAWSRLGPRARKARGGCARAHTGVSNIEPDALSRLKGGECSLPVRCRSDSRVTVPALDRSYFHVALSMSRTKAYVLLYRFVIRILIPSGRSSNCRVHFSGSIRDPDLTLSIRDPDLASSIHARLLSCLRMFGPTYVSLVYRALYRIKSH